MATNGIAGGNTSGVNGFNGVNGVNGHSMGGLNILVAGAGIAGLAAAIGLRRQGHHVQVFEQSAFARETGAAVHIAPNANGVLKKLGIDVEAIGANRMDKLTEFASSGEVQRSMDLTEANRIWQHDWRLAHRIRLHEALKKLAVSSEIEGPPAVLHLNSGVADVDPQTSTLTLKSGEVVHGDLVVGADGVHSVCRSKVEGGQVRPFGSGKAAFRFMVERQTALEDPVTRRFAETHSELLLWYGSDRRVVMYPTSNNTLLNFICIHPEEESEASDDWTTATTKESLLKVYKDFDPACIALIGKANPESLKSWKLLDMDILPTWINERLCILGDAAHPFLPHQGQGAGVAMEDSAALSVVFEKGVKPDEVPERLKLWQSIRYERANRIQQYSRLAGRDLKKDVPFDMTEYTNYNFGHDEFDNSTQKLREWKWSKRPDMYWRMPIAFGPMPGPRQSHYGIVRQAEESTFRTASIKFKTSRTVLQNLFPPGRSGWRFKSPGTVAYCSFSCTTLNKMEWLGGTGYSHIGLYIHGVEYEKSNGEVINGTYMPILFESLTDPIVSGREELGMPKLYTSVDIFHGATSFRINTGWQGSMWGAFRLEGLKPDTDMASATGKISGEDDEGILTYRYMPKVGRECKGQPAEEYTVFVPFAQDEPKPKLQRAWTATSASIKIDALDWEALPTLHHIISRLQEIPVYEVVKAKVVEGMGVPDVGQAQRV